MKEKLSNYIFFTTIFFFFTYSTRLAAQTNDHASLTKSNDSVPFNKQRDIIDIAMLTVHKDISKRLDTTNGSSMKLRLSASPIIEYTISTGFTTGIAAGGAFVTSLKQQTNTSFFLFAVKYTQRKQFLLPIQSSFWTPGNKFNFIGDWRYLNFPQDTWGIGGGTTDANKNMVTYKYLRLYELCLKQIVKNFYIGGGYQLDYHWGIAEYGVLPGEVTDFNKYGFSNHSVSSGIVLDVQYDSRQNSINPDGGSMFANCKFIQNSRLLGSDTPWNGVQIDIRKYFALPLHIVLGFWFYSVLTTSGNPPYLDLPGTGTDSYNNTARGYVQGRYIGKKYIDLESELRFPISKNGLLGGVVFASSGSVSEFDSNTFQTIFPSFGAGLRIKFNKFSKTNICVDYGFGVKGSHGFGGNLGEVF